jgi:DNA-binding NarL/FixJ family response regulator
MVSDEPSLIEAAAGLQPQLVILDLSLSTNQEPCIAERLLKSNPSLRVVVLSSHDEQAVADRLMAAGAAGFVVKQSIGTDLLPAVRVAIAGGAYMSPSVRTALNKTRFPKSDKDDTNFDTKRK